MKKVKVLFDGFGKDGNYEDREEACVIMELLKKNYNVELTQSPDYIFCNVDSKQYYKFDGIRIFCTIEAICPDFNLCDYGIGFEYLNYGDRYFRFPNFYFNQEITNKMVDKHKNITDDLVDRDFCSFVYSNAKAESIRRELFETLNTYKKVDSGGRYLNNTLDGQLIKNKFDFEKKHKFSISCENASHPGYHTEKLAEAFAAKTIPIYWGDPEVKKVFNSKAFINCRDYSSIEEVLKRVIYLDTHSQEYLAMLHEPALLNIPEKSEKNFSEEKLEELERYLVHIFDQPLEDAYRRNRGFWGKQYLQTKRSEGRVIERYNMLQNMKGLQLLRKIRNGN